MFNSTFLQTKNNNMNNSTKTTTTSCVLSSQTKISLLKKFILRTAGALALFLFLGGSVWGQVSSYTFSESAGTYTPITGGVNYDNFTSWSNTNFLDDNSSSALESIGFNFVYKGTTYTQFGVNANGFISLGSLPTSSYAPLSTGASNNVISAMGADLIGRGSLLANRTTGSAVITITGGDISLISVGDKVSGTGIPAGSTVLSKTATTVTISANATSNSTGGHFRFSRSTFGIRFQTIGTSPNRSLVVQWTGWQRYTTSSAFGELYNFQIILNETANTINIVYNIQGPTTTTATTYQIGLRGSSNTDYNNRSSTTTWAGTAAGTANTSTLTLSNTVLPSSGRTFSWTPPAPPACEAPSALTSSNITSTSATISWSAASPAPASGYQYFYSTIATAPTAVTTPLGTTAAGVVTANITGLTANTTYYYWVRSNCGGSGTSTWAGSSTFFTGYCTPSPTSVDGTGITNVSFGTVNNTTTSEAGNYGNYSAQIGAGNQGMLLNVNVTFSTGYTYGTKIWVDWNNDLLFTDATELMYTGLSGSANPSTLNASFTIPQTAVPGNYRMRIGGTDTDTGPTNACYNSSFGSFEDYTLQVIVPAPCSGTPTPGNTLTSSASVASGANFTLSLQNATSGTGVTYQWQHSTDGGSNWADIALATSSTLVTSQTAVKSYRCNVTCSGSTGTSNPVAVGLKYCSPTTTNGCTDGDVIARVILNTLDNNSGTGCPSGTLGYSNYTGNSTLTTTLLPSSSYNCTVYAGEYGEGYAAWIDYNDNYVFETSERVGFSNGQVAGSGAVGVLGSSATFPITISCTPPSGVHRLRVRAMYATNGSAVDPCANNSYGEIEDYLITIQAPPACPSAGALTSTGVTNTSASFSWTLGCATATNYDFEYGPAGFTQGTGTTLSNQAATITAGSGSFTLNGLTASTSYDVYFRANCGGAQSTWSAMTNVYTAHCVPSSTNTSSTNTLFWLTNVSTTFAAANFNNSSVLSANGYGDYTATQSVSAFAGTSFNLSASYNGINYYNFAKVWVDWNNDFDFNDAGETMYTSPTLTSAMPFSASLTVPALQAVGSYRIRVRLDMLSYTNGILDPCGLTQLGETEDYTLIVLPQIPASITSISEPNLLCPGGGVIITGQNFYGVTGVTIGGQPVLSYSVINSTTISAVNSIGGAVVVTNAFGASAEVFSASTPALNPQIISSTQQFCGVGSGIQLTATDLPTSASILWESLTPSAAFTLEASTANPASTTLSETSNFRLTVSVTGCPVYQTVKSIGVYPLPTATVTTSASGVCPGTPVTINSGLSAGNFTSTDISSNINYSTPSNASSSVVTLVNNGAYVVAPSGASSFMDDFYYSNINIPFSFDYFGNNYTSCNIGSNGVVSFGTAVAEELQDYTFVNLPSDTEPLNMVASCAHDMYYYNTGAIRYWTQGYAPNRVFVVDYSGVGNWAPGGSTSTTSSQIKFYETLGIVEASVLSTQATSNKIIGLQNADASVGVIANSVTSVYTNRSYRFSPPAEYSIIWTANSSTFAGGTGLNIFSLDLSPQVTTTYVISYANTATGCANLPGSAQATTVVLSPAPITGVVTTSTVSSVCAGSTVPLSHSYTGITDALTYQWQDSIHGGLGWSNIPNATTSTYSAIQNVASSYRVGISRCGGVISYAAPLAIPMSIIAEPTITVSSPESTVCYGTPVTFTANIANQGTLPSACNYTFNMLDSWGDGWNGNTMSVLQGTTVVATLGLASGSSAAQTVSLQSGLTYTLFWNPTPTSLTYPGEVGINVVNPSGTIIYSMPFNSSGLKGTTLTTITPNCTSTATESLLAFSTIAWQVNEVAVSGANGLNYTTSSLNPSDVVTASVSVLLPCPSNTVVSPPAALVVTPALIPTVDVTASASSACQGAPVTFTASGSPANVGGPVTSCNYTFNMLDSWGDGWNGAEMKVMNGTTVVATLTGPANLNAGFSALPNSLAQTVSLQSGLTYTLFWNQAGLWPVEVGVSVVNASGVTVYSMDFDNDALAGTTLATIAADCAPPSPYQWILNGSPIAGVTGATYTSSALSSTDVITVSYSTNAPCYSTAPVTSNSVSVSVIPSTSVTTTVTAASSYTWADDGEIYTASGVYAGTTTNCVTQMLNLTILPTLTLQVLLDGYYVIGSSPAEMRAARYNNLVAAIPGSPTSPAYIAALAALSGNTQDVDLITVQLRGTTIGLPILHTATPMLKIDGSVICEFPASAIGGSYYVVVDHRASMPLWSQNPITLTNSSTLNFANTLASAYSDGYALLTPMKTISSGLYGIWMGELDQDGYLDAFDYSNLEGDIYESGYLDLFLLDGDLNGDTYVDGTDFAVYDGNSILGLYEQRPY